MTILVVGDVVTDTVVQLHANIVYGGDTEATITDTMGGQGANVARWLVRTGVEQVRLVAAVSHADAVDQHHELRQVGVTPQLFSIDAAAARIVVVVDAAGTERSFLTQRGAAAMLDESHAEAIDLSAVQWCHVSGYLLASPSGRKFYARFKHRCDALSIPISFDPSSISEVRRHGAEELLALIGPVAVLIPNEAEACALAGTVDPAVAAIQLLDHATSVVVKRGSAGSLAVSQQTGMVETAAYPADVVDPTGAGDACAAGLLSELVRGSDLAAAAQTGSRFGALAVSLRGAF
jgi:sugar/nucleoside kinase (ribokinase family)